MPGSRGVRAAPSSIIQAKHRLGDEPLRWLFERLATAWGHASARRHAWRGLALYGADGTTIRVPDSVENRVHFGGQGTRWDSTSGYPLVRMVTLMALRSRILAGASCGPYSNNEHTYAEDLWPLIPADSPTIVDRGLLGARVLIGFERTGTNRHWLTRATAQTKMKRHATGDRRRSRRAHRMRARAPAGCRTFAPMWLTSILPERRERNYPRAVEIKMSNYERKRPAKSSSQRRAK